MDIMIKDIVEADHLHNEEVETLRKQLRELTGSLASRKQQLYDELMKQFKAEAVSEQDQFAKKLDSAIEACIKQASIKEAILDEKYETNKDRWVEELLTHILGS